MTRQAISPRLATRTVLKRAAPRVSALPACVPGVDRCVAVLVCMVIAGSHPEEAEGSFRQGGAGDDIEGQAQDGAGIGGVDDAVIPQPGGGVVGTALVLVLPADGCLEGFLVVGSPFLPGGFVLVPFDRG